jgi:hypothetical protein
MVFTEDTQESSWVSSLTPFVPALEYRPGPLDSTCFPVYVLETNYIEAGQFQNAGIAPYENNMNMFSPMLLRLTGH